MAEGPESGQERTEAPTQRRLQRARESGQVAVSNELSLLAVLASATLALAWDGPAAGDLLVRTFRAVLEHAAAGEADPFQAMKLAGLMAARLTAPVVAVLVAGIGAVLLQTGGLVSLAPLRPDPSRISPMAGLRRLVSLDSAGETVRSLLKLLLIGGVLWRTLPERLSRLPGWPFPDAATLARGLVDEAVHLLGAILLVQALVAVLDVIWVRARLTARLRMSRTEIKEEQKETDGDPRIKIRLRRLRMARSKRRMLAAVPKAAVVVTNPTHYAVALAYDRGSTAAPRVVAKGVDAMAEKIREAARAHRVPLVPNPPLARALHRLELDQEIPAEHYKAVAEIIAFVWRLRDRARTL